MAKSSLLKENATAAIRVMSKEIAIMIKKDITEAISTTQLLIYYTLVFNYIM